MCCPLNSILEKHRRIPMYYRGGICRGLFLAAVSVGDILQAGELLHAEVVCTHTGVWFKIDLVFEGDEVFLVIADMREEVWMHADAQAGIAGEVFRTG